MVVVYICAVCNRVFVIHFIDFFLEGKQRIKCVAICSPSFYNSSEVSRMQNELCAMYIPQIITVLRRSLSVSVLAVE